MNFACNGAPTGAPPAFLALALERSAMKPARGAGFCLSSPGFAYGVPTRADRILKGEKPANLPVQAPTKTNW